jgi:GT2 family glycosyltransferase
MRNSKIGIVTILYNSEAVLFDFFESLAKQTYQNFILYVIDNKSPDNSLDLSTSLTMQYSFQIEIIANDDNYGVAKGNNIGIKKALNDNCDMILLSNNDIIFEANCIEVLLQNMQDYNIDMAVPKIYYWGTNKLWYAGGNFSKLKGIVCHTGYLQEDTGIYNTPKSVDYAPTCFMLINKEVVNKVGLMDEKYFVYYDDTDFVFRAIHSGMKLWYIPQSVVQHKVSVSTGGADSDFSLYYKNRNFIYFVRKNHSFFIALYYLLLQFARLMEKIFKLNKRQIRLLAKAYKDGMLL